MLHEYLNKTFSVMNTQILKDFYPKILLLLLIYTTWTAVERRKISAPAKSLIEVTETVTVNDAPQNVSLSAFNIPVNVKPAEPKPEAPKSRKITKLVEIPKTVFVEDKPKAVLASEKRYTDYQIAIWLLKSHEGLRYRAYWDVSQWSIGWGTKSHKGEVITREEADKRTYAEYSRVLGNIQKRYPKLDRWHQLVLAVMDYNVGKFGKRLDRAAQKGDVDEIAKVMRKYYYSSKGKKLAGLVKRRNAEADILIADPETKQDLAQKYRDKVRKSILKAKKLK